MYVDCKLTIWERVELTPEQAKKVEDALKNGVSEPEVRDIIDDFGVGGLYIIESAEVLTKEDNQGNPTIELFGDKGEQIETN